MSHRHDHDVEALFAPARTITPGRETIDAALGRVPHRPARRPARGRAFGGPLRRVLATSVVLLVALAGLGYAAAPPIRAAIDDAAGTFTGWLGTGRTAAGRPVTVDDRLPGYMRDPAIAARTRVVAEAGGYRLFAVRRASGMIDFDLGNTGVGMGFPPDSLLDHDVRVLGPGSMRTADRRGHVPLFGVTSKTVTTVELENGDGTASPRIRVAGAFVLLAEPDRRPLAVVGRDARGTTVERVRVDESAAECPCIDWSAYAKR